MPPSVRPKDQLLGIIPRHDEGIRARLRRLGTRCTLKVGSMALW